MTGPRLTAEQRRALEILAEAGINGVTDATLLAHGFRRAALAVFVRKGLARARRETVMAGRKAIEVYRARITTAIRHHSDQLTILLTDWQQTDVLVSHTSCRFAARCTRVYHVNPFLVCTLSLSLSLSLFLFLFPGGEYAGTDD
jgi:hypothetical protein